MKPAPSPYRWNLSEFASGYDAAAQIIHPHYLAIQDAILELLPDSLKGGGLVVDLGGGSGRLIERILNRYPLATGLIIDQSEPFLALAERRLYRFGPRATCIQARLQDNWPQSVVRGSPDPAPPIAAFVSMSAIHHLDPAEKQALYQTCYDTLAPGGLLLNGDEIRADSDHDYLAALTRWGDYMRHHMADGTIPATFHSAPRGWIDRNVTRFGQEKKSGDDCHEPIATQLACFRNAGFTTTNSPWQKDLWAILRGVK